MKPFHRLNSWTNWVTTTVARAMPVVIVLSSTCLAGYFAVFFLPERAASWMLKTDVVTDAEVWSRRILAHLDDGSGSFSDQRLSAADVDYLMTIPETSDIYRLKMFNSAGKTFWSTRASDIELTTNNTFFRNIVARGEVFSKFEYKKASDLDRSSLFSSAPSQTENERLIAEIYVPIIENGKFVGSIEFYTDISEVHEVLAKRIQRGMNVAVAVMLVLVVLVCGLTWNNSRQKLHLYRRQNARERETIEKQMQLAREVGLLSDLNEWLQSSKSLAELFGMVSKFMETILPESEGSVYVYSHSRDVLEGASAWNGGVLKDYIHPDECWGLRRGRTYTYGAGQVDFVCEHADPHDGEPYFCFPILAHGETVGLMHLKKRKDVDVDKFMKSRKLAQMCAEQISMAVANVRMRDQLEEQSIRDPLTGLYNRRYLMDRLRRLLENSKAKKKMVHILYVDVDHFKQFNDNHGHDAGDLVLRTVAEVFIDSCENDDIASRMGGEEFMLIWPQISLQDLQDRAEVLRKDVESMKVQYGDVTLPGITISTGVATFPTNGMIAQDLLRIADEALYTAKNNGRNQVVYAQKGGKPQPPKKKPPTSLAAE